VEPTNRGKARVRDGLVVSDKMDKTVIVQFERIAPHRKYKKYLRRSRKVKAHDSQNQCRVGDRVRIIETRPLSRDKRWRVQQVLEKAI
jgi:small subunit ribosomal protein S17